MESETNEPSPELPPWRPDAIVLLVAAIMLGFSLGGIALWGTERLAGAAEQDRRFLRFVIGSFCLQGLGLFYIHLFLKSHGARWKDFLGLKADAARAVVKPALITAVFAIPATMLLNWFAAWLISLFQEPMPQAVLSVVKDNSAWWQRSLIVLAAVGVAPVFEEALFRGVLYRAVKNMGYPSLALAGTSLIFGASHLTLMTFLPLTFLAMVLALLYDKTAGLLAPIIVHALFNAINLVILMTLDGKTMVGW